MAQGRIISKSISLSEKANIISDGASLLYTWMIPHSDDFGLLQGSALTIKALVAPMRNWTIEQVEGFLQEMLGVGLIELIVFKNKNYYRILNQRQSLRKDRQPQTILQVDFGSDVTANWQAVESQISHKDDACHDSDKPMAGIDMTNPAEEKRREEKRFITGDAKARPAVKTSENSPLFPEIEPPVHKPKPQAPPEPPKSRSAPASSIADILGSRAIDPPKTSKGVATEWQEMAFRYASELKIDFSPPEINAYKPRWLKTFKQTNPGRLDRAYRYLKDHPNLGNMTADHKIKLFFKMCSPPKEIPTGPITEN